MKIFIGADHNGLDAKKSLIKYLEDKGYEVIDKGSETLQPGDDFITYAIKIVHEVLQHGDDEARGILLCRSGQGMAIAANRFKGIRAVIVWDGQEAKWTRNDDNSNILCIPAWDLNQTAVQLIVDTWLTTPFSGAARYVRRNNELDRLG